MVDREASTASSEDVTADTAAVTEAGNAASRSDGVILALPLDRMLALLAIPYHRCSDDFVFDSQMVCQAVFFGLRAGEISCPARYFAEASSINFRRSIVYGLGVLATSLMFRLHKLGIARSALFLPYSNV